MIFRFDPPRWTSRYAPRILDRSRCVNTGLPGRGRCLEWQGSTTADGYGKIHTRKGPVQQSFVHRLVYEHFVGDLNGHTVDHLCRNRACVNPLHLAPMSHVENCRQGAYSRWNIPVELDTLDGLECGIGSDPFLLLVPRCQNTRRPNGSQ